MRPILFFMVMVMASQSLAADTILVIPEKGKPYTFDTSTGERTTLSVNAVYVDSNYGKGGNIPNTPDDPKNDTPDSTELRTQVEEWASEVDDTAGSRIFAALFDVLGDRIESGQIPADSTSIDKALTEAVNIAVEHFPRGSDPKDWKKVKLKIQNEVSRIAISSGGTLTKDRWTQIFRDIQYGFEDTYSGEAIPLWLAPILNALIEALISMLRNMF